MSERRLWSAGAPANIALIKYMGKTNSADNRPTNTSISYTLSNLKSLVELELRDGSTTDDWQPLHEYRGQRLVPFEMSGRGRERFLAHLQFLKRHFSSTAAFVVRSNNDFPSDCGLASSASSFAALTRAAVTALCELTERALPDEHEIADLSRSGSGSSCRSFFQPWAIWHADQAGGSARGSSSASSRVAVEALNLPPMALIHQVIVVDSEKKEVSSSEAHRRVISSLLFQNRVARAEQRAADLIQALTVNDWRAAFEISWAEFWDMHALFETSQPSFGYMTSGSLEVLRWVKAQTWDLTGLGPLITMDAGPNVHLLFRKDRVGLEQAQMVQQRFAKAFRVITDGGEG